jgi:streptogramin lyase
LWRVDPSNGNSELVLPDSKLPISVMAVDATQIFGAGSHNGETELGRLDLSTHQLTWFPTPPDGWEPSALAYDPSGILYVAEEYRQRVRGLVLATGKVFDLVGKPGEKGLRTGPLATARLNGPTGLAILPNGGLAILDGAENTVVVVR